MTMGIGSLECLGSHEQEDQDETQDLNINSWLVSLLVLLFIESLAHE